MDKSLRLSLNAAQIKILAAICMLIDHVGLSLYPDILVFRAIGRLAFPIVCFFLVEGALHTSNIRKYELRMLIFAIISEIPFDLGLYHRAFLFTGQNVIWTLLISLVMLDILEHTKNPFIRVLSCAFLVLLAQYAMTDYGGMGVILVLGLYFFKDYPLWRYVFMALYFVYYAIDIWQPEIFGLISAVFIFLYNGEKGNTPKYGFYVFYPAHLLVIFAVWFLFFR